MLHYFGLFMKKTRNEVTSEQF